MGALLCPNIPLLQIYLIANHGKIKVINGPFLQIQLVAETIDKIYYTPSCLYKYLESNSFLKKCGYTEVI
jgi:hypothetical protein